jgi:hypothetical protein
MQLTEDDLAAVATDLGVNADFALGDNDAVRHARARVEADIASSRASGVRFTPTFYINRRRYDGPWEGIVWKNSQNVGREKLDFARRILSARVIVTMRRVGGPHAARSPARPNPCRILLQGHTWRQLAGAGALAGIGFTMSLFIGGQAFPSATDFSPKIAVFAASILSAVVGTALLWGASRQELIEEATQSAGMQVS